ncbi:MAG: hypothetical protein SH850_00810 [Planctomycetaceae bacterium]|nr:hypothetical protein [Planctomycetaceae bacterium]
MAHKQASKLWPDCVDPGAITTGPGGSFGVYPRDAKTRNPVPIHDLSELWQWIEDHRERVARWSSDPRLYPAAIQWAGVALEHGTEWLQFFHAESSFAWHDAKNLADAKSQLLMLSNQVREVLPKTVDPKQSPARKKRETTDQKMLAAINDNGGVEITIGWTAARFEGLTGVKADTIKKCRVWKGLMADRKVRQASAISIDRGATRGDARHNGRAVKR